MIIFLLIIIAIGVLLISESGRALLGIGFGLAVWVCIGFVIFAGVLLISNSKGNATTQTPQTSTASGSTLGNTTNSLNPQKPETGDDIFDLKNNPYAWYDRHNVAMAYRCYSSSCTPAQWAQSVYNNESDSRGQVLYENALKSESSINATFPTGLCVTEQGVKICELGYGDEMTKNTPNDTLVIRGNEFKCIDLKKQNSVNYKTNFEAPLILKSVPSDTFCVSDSGGIEINKTIEVKKYWGRIMRNSNSSNYYIPQSNYGTCIWTSEGGNAGIPEIHIASSNSGLDYNFHAVKAFCVNGDNQVDIYTTE
jgi:hypothetical protein